MNTRIIDTADAVVRRYKTRNPEDIISQRAIKLKDIRFCHDLLGYYTVLLNCEYIGINPNCTAAQRISALAHELDTHCLTGSMPAPARHFKTPIFIVWTTPRQKDEQISLLPNCFCRTMIFLNRLAITNSMPTVFIWRQICHPTHLQLIGR